MDKLQIAIVIPAFNEEATILDVVQSATQYGTVVVVNDASTDNTKQIIESTKAILVNHEKNKGYDEALNSGFLKAKKMNCDVVITLDADGQHSQKYIQKYIDLLRQGFKVVVGTRDRFQRISEHIFSWVSAWKWGIKDPLCGMKAYHIDVFNELGCFDSYHSIGTELAIYAASKKIRIVQQPIKIKKRQGKPRFGVGFSANMTILRALWIGYKKY